MASSYVNNLRLNEMATGDASGTWGTITNTNLELIGEALGFGTEAITTNADTHTTTVADGASDGGRAMYLKYTGTLDSACTITIAPNTMKRMQFIENGTSGSQNIIISQGSGANITIPPGDTKAVYLDGAGSGAAVVDAFASLNVVDLKVQDDLTVTDDLIVNGDIDLEGSIDVNGTANLDVVDIDGAVDMASTLAVAGVVTANAGVVVDNITIDGTEIDLSSGDLTLDVAGDIILDADGTQVILKDGGTEFGHLYNTNSDFGIKSTISDKDIKFVGNDGGSIITALQIDMSDAGTAIFNHDVKIADNSKAIFGNAGDLEIYHDGSNSYIQDTGTGQLRIDTNGTDVRVTKSNAEFMATFNADGAVDLYHNNVKRLETSANGLEVLNTASGEEALVRIKASTNGNSAIAFGDTGNVNVGKIDYNHADNSFAFDTNSSERMRIDSGGDVMLGMTTSLGSTLGVNSQIGIGTDSNNRAILNYASNVFSIGTIQSGTAGFDVLQITSGNCGIGTAPDSNRQLHVQTPDSGAFCTMVDCSHASGQVFGLDIFFSGEIKDNHNSEYIRTRDTGAVRFKVLGDGDVQNHDNSYGALSDVKLKEQIEDASSQWDDIKALKVRKYKMKEDVARGDSGEHWRLGVVAQEVETAGMNGLVRDNIDYTETDGILEDSGTVTKSIKYSILYMKAVKALQEAMTRIETLEAKVATLENA